VVLGCLFIAPQTLPTGQDLVALYRIQKPSYLLTSSPLYGRTLTRGTFAYVFYLQREPGSLGGLFQKANDAVRLEVWDVTAQERVASRTLQQVDFDGPWHRLQVKKVLFSSYGREGHSFEPRVYWPGLVSVRLARVELEKFEDWNEKDLRARAERLEELMQERFLENGFVVMRDAQGRAEDWGDTGIWTGLYAASQAWRYQATQSPEALARMHAALRALHRLHAESPVRGTLLRAIYPDGTPHPHSASKDTYTGFVFAVNQCRPWIRDPKLRMDLDSDVAAIGNHLLDHQLRFEPQQGRELNLNPSFSDEVITDLFREMKRKPQMRTNILRAFGLARLYFRIMGQSLPKSFQEMTRAIDREDEARFRAQVIPFLNDTLKVLSLIERNVERSARPAERLGLTESPYQKVHYLLRTIRERWSGRPMAFSRIEDMTVLPSQSLHSLHLIKMASLTQPHPNRFDRYYEQNLYRDKALLRTALDWGVWDELLITSLFGEVEAARHRGSSSHLPYLALYNLILSEKDAKIRSQYVQLFERHRLFLEQDLNAMADLMGPRLGLRSGNAGLGYWSLHRYPEDRVGKGDRYWRSRIRGHAEEFGGLYKGRTRDALPADRRPRDAFVWQRSSRSVRGDHEGWSYAPVDYLFLWWMSRSASREAVSEKR